MECYKFALAVRYRLVELKERAQQLRSSASQVLELAALEAYYASERASSPVNWVHLDMDVEDLARYRRYLRQVIQYLRGVEARTGLPHPQLLGARRLRKRVAWLINSFFAAPGSEERTVVIRAAELLKTEYYWRG